MHGTHPASPSQGCRRSSAVIDKKGRAPRTGLPVHKRAQRERILRRRWRATPECLIRGCKDRERALCSQRIGQTRFHDAVGEGLEVARRDHRIADVLSGPRILVPGGFAAALARIFMNHLRDSYRKIRRLRAPHRSVSTRGVLAPHATLRHRTSVCDTTSAHMRCGRRSMGLNEIEVARVKKVVREFIERRRPPPHIRPQLDLKISHLGSERRDL